MPINHTFLTEFHLSTTLNKPDREEIAIDTGLENLSTTLDDELLLAIGPLDDSSLALNVVLGLSSEFGNTRITHGFGAPIRDGFDRGFDFEYSLIVGKSFGRRPMRK